MMERRRVWSLVRAHAANENMVNHMLATEAIMRRLPSGLGEDRERWALAGLVHDLDAAETAQTMEVHGHRTVEWLREAGLTTRRSSRPSSPTTRRTDPPSTSPMDRALFSADPLTGLMTAAAPSSVPRRSSHSWSSRA